MILSEIHFNMKKLIDELDTAYTFAIDNCDTTTEEWLKKYKLMNNCIEQYRREYCSKLIKNLNKWTVTALDVWEIHLHLKGTIMERLEQILALDFYE